MSEQMITSALAKAHQVRHDVVPDVSWRAMVATNNLDNWRRLIVSPDSFTCTSSQHLTTLSRLQQPARIEYDEVRARDASLVYPPCHCEPPPQQADSEDDTTSTFSGEGSDTDNTHSSQ